MRLLALLAVATAMLAWPATAFGHASIESTHPGYRERLESSPERIVLRFSQTVQAFPRSVEAFDERGRLVSGPATGGGDGLEVSAPLDELPAGAYTVRWYALSYDGHIVSGLFTFGVRTDAPPPTEAYGAASQSLAEHAVRWAYFVALALLSGGLALRLLCLPRELPPRVERRLRWLAGGSVAATLELGGLAFLLRADAALQLPFERFLYGDLSPIAGGSRFGQAFIAMTLGFALVAALVFLAWLADRRWPLWAALVVTLGFASGLSLAGHQGAEADSTWYTGLADWLHLGAALVWAGGLVALAACVWPLAPELRRQAFLRFSRLASWLVAVLVAAGVYLAILRLPAASDLWTTDYGRVLLVKLGIVAVALAWGAVHRFAVAPALARGTPPDGGHGVLRSLAGESVVGTAILLVAAVLVGSEPPRA